MTPLESVQRVNDQGGLVLIPHPFDRVRPSALKLKALMEILPFVDLMEGYNGHTLLAADNNRGVDVSRTHALPTVACSDAHSALERGSSYTEVPEPEYDGTPDGLVRAVRAGKIVGKRPTPLLLMAPGYARLRKVLA
jgi:predicted metal-dependent phosphoesterase TrpH